MSQADETDTTRPNRRRVFLAVSGPLFATALPASSSTPPADVHLLGLSEPFHAAMDVQKAAEVALEHGGDPQVEDRAYLATRAIVREIASLPARSLDGLKLKARAVAWCYGGPGALDHPGGLIDPDVDSIDITDTILLEGIARDLLAMS